MRRSPESRGELDLVPVMNLVAILIPFLLFSAQFVELSVIEPTIPSMAPDPVDAPDEPLALRLRITELGFEVSAARSALPEPVEIGCVGGFCRSPGSWDVAELTSVLAALKRSHPNEDAMVVTPDSDVPYEVLVGALDAARSDSGELLFPKVMVAGGA